MTNLDEDDFKIVRRVLSGDRDAFALLVQRHGQAIHQQMRNYSRDLRTCEELAQDVFVEAFLNLDKFRGEAPFRNWLSRIATITGYKYWKRRKKKRMEVEFSEERDWTAPESTPVEKNPDAAKRLVYDILAVLPHEYRLVLTLSYLENCSHDEIARRLGWRKSMVAMRIFRAKGKLRKIARNEPWKGTIQWILS